MELGLKLVNEEMETGELETGLDEAELDKKVTVVEDDWNEELVNKEVETGELETELDDAELDKTGMVVEDDRNEELEVFVLVAKDRDEEEHTGVLTMFPLLSAQFP